MAAGIIANNELKSRLSAELPNWQAGAGAIERSFSTTGWKSSLMLVNAVGFLAEVSWHHPELEVGYDAVKVILTTHSEGGVTEKDLELAKKIDELVCWPLKGSALQPPPQRFPIIKPDPED